MLGLEGGRRAGVFPSARAGGGEPRGNFPPYWGGRGGTAREFSPMLGLEEGRRAGIFPSAGAGRREPRGNCPLRWGWGGGTAREFSPVLGPELQRYQLVMVKGKVCGLGAGRLNVPPPPTPVSALTALAGNARPPGLFPARHQGPPKPAPQRLPNQRFALLENHPFSNTRWKDIFKGPPRGHPRASGTEVRRRRRIARAHLFQGYPDASGGGVRRGYSCSCFMGHLRALRKWRRAELKITLQAVF